MNSTTKALIGCLLIVGLWIGFQNLHQPEPKATPACDVTASGGG